MQHLQGLIPQGAKGIARTTARMCLKNLLTYNYETALAVIYAMEDVLMVVIFGGIMLICLQNVKKF